MNGMMQDNMNGGMNMQGNMSGGMNMQSSPSSSMMGGSMMGGMNSGSSMNMQGGSSSSGMGMMGMMGGKKVLIVSKHCTQCKKCEESCPMGIAPHEFRGTKLSSYNCIQCGNCTKVWKDKKIGY